MAYQKTCELCGAPLVNTRARRYCAECKIKAEIAAAERAQAKRREKERREKQARATAQKTAPKSFPRRPMTLREAAVAADKAGMSYGVFVQKGLAFIGGEEKEVNK